VLGKNVFDDSKHRQERKFITPAGEVQVNHFLKPFELRLFELRKQAYTIQLTHEEQKAMDEFEVRYHRNRSLFKSGSAPQLTVMGSHKQHPEVRHEVIAPGSERVTGLLGQNKLSQNHFVQQLVHDRRARVAKHNAQDMKTFFTAEEKARIFAGKEPVMGSGES